jgi:DNA repair protein RecN (Recombination protein N)
VLCVTHLPQVAAQAHQHIRVSKNTKNNVTSTQLETLDRDATTDEIARMLGGARVTKKSRQHARELLDAAFDD